MGPPLRARPGEVLHTVRYWMYINSFNDQATLETIPFTVCVSRRVGHFTEEWDQTYEPAELRVDVNIWTELMSCSEIFSQNFNGMLLLIHTHWVSHMSQRHAFKPHIVESQAPKLTHHHSLIPTYVFHWNVIIIIWSQDVWEADLIEFITH